jgi:hypothetical protein
MRKLNQVQKEKITKGYNHIAYMIIKNVEKYGNEKETLENDTQLAYDIMLQQAE